MALTAEQRLWWDRRVRNAMECCQFAHANQYPSYMFHETIVAVDLEMRRLGGRLIRLESLLREMASQDLDGDDRFSIAYNWQRAARAGLEGD